MTNPSGPSHDRKYRLIASDLRAAISRGEYPAQARLPGENDLMRQYQVARMTARQAASSALLRRTRRAPRVRQKAGPSRRLQA